MTYLDGGVAALALLEAPVLDPPTFERAVGLPPAGPPGPMLGSSAGPVEVVDPPQPPIPAIRSKTARTPRFPRNADPRCMIPPRKE